MYVSEQIYYAGPINNPGFEILPVRSWFSVLLCYLIFILSSFLEEEEVEDRIKFKWFPLAITKKTLLQKSCYLLLGTYKRLNTDFAILVFNILCSDGPLGILWADSSRGEGHPCSILQDRLCLQGLHGLKSLGCGMSVRLAVQRKEETCKQPCRLIGSQIPALHYYSWLPQVNKMSPPGPFTGKSHS